MMVPYAKPGTTTINKTGKWKAFRPKVNASICVKCSICHNFCPEGIMGQTSQAPNIDFNYCKGCGICAVECPVKAIVMIREPNNQPLKKL